MIKWSSSSSSYPGKSGKRGGGCQICQVPRSARTECATVLLLLINTLFMLIGISVNSYHHNSVSSTAALLPSWRQQQQKKIDQPFSIRLFFAAAFFRPDWTFVTSSSSSKKGKGGAKGAPIPELFSILSASIHILQSVSQF